MSAFSKMAVLSAAVITVLPAAYATAATPVYAGPGYTTSGGYRGSTSSTIPSGLSAASAGGNGLTILSETYYTGASNATATISNGIVINPLAANGYTVLGQVPGATAGYSVVALNPGASLIAGTAMVTSTSTGATVWTPNGTAYVLPLPAFPGVAASFVPNSTARAINDSGTVVGGGNYYTTAGRQSSGSGYVYYNAGTSAAPNYSGGSAVQLLPLGPSNANTVDNQNVTVNGITSSGVAAGSSSLSFGTSTITYGSSATYWTAGNSATTSTIAGNQLTVAPVTGGTYSGYSFFKTDASGNSMGTGYTSAANGVSPGLSSDVNPGGYAFGSVTLYAPVSGSVGTSQPVRWNSLSATPGQVLSLPSATYTTGSVFAVNNHGDAVGTATSPTVVSPELWKAGSTTPTALGGISNATVVANPGGQIPASPSYSVRGINDSGLSVGYAIPTTSSGTPVDALLWDANGSVTELDALVTLTPQTGTSSQVVVGVTYPALPTYGAAGWVALVGAYSITNDGWVSGLGVYYDPNAVGYTSTGNPAPMSTYGNGTYYRAFEIQVPEPASLATLALGGVGLLRRRAAGM